MGQGCYRSVHAQEGGGIRFHRRLSARLQKARPPPGAPQGLWFRARAAILDEQDGETLRYQFRLIINWDRDLI